MGAKTRATVFSMRPLLALGCAALAAGCFEIPNKRDALATAVRDYNDGVRWNKLDQAARFLPLEVRQRFVDRHVQLADELEIADYEIERVDLGPKNETAEVRVQVTWVAKARGIVEKTLVAEKWERKEGDWYMTREKRLSGAPLTYYEEDPKRRQ
jgi:hypothetical protein